MFDHNSVDHLRNGKLLLVTQQKTHWILGNLKSEKYISFTKDYQTHILKSVLLLPEIGQLTHYLKHVPELAWDIVEFAEKSLEVIYPGGRNLPNDFLSENGEIHIRVYKEGLFHKFLFNQKHHLLLTQLSDAFPQTEFLLQNENVLNLPDNFEWKVKADKVMSLGMNGEIKFY